MRILHVLLIEDNQDHALLTRKVLGQCEEVASIQVIGDGEAALAYMRKTASGDNDARTDLILLDINLPRADGFQVLKEIKSNPRLAFVPVILLTTSAREEEIARGYRLGANSYVTKPVQFDEFARKIRLIGEYWSRVSELPSKRAVP